MADGILITDVGNRIGEIMSEIHKGIKIGRDYFMIIIDDRSYVQIDMNVITGLNMIPRTNTTDESAITVVKTTAPYTETSSSNGSQYADPVSSSSSQNQTTTTSGENITSTTREYEGED